MTITFKNSSLVIALLLGITPLVAVHADAKATFMQECAAKWKTAKTSGTVPSGTKWTDFVKTDCAANANATTTAPITPAVAPAIKKKTPTTTATQAPAGGTFMKNCSAQWKSMKDAGSIPAGLTWKQFVKQSCAVDSAVTTSSISPDNVIPAEPNGTNYANIDVTKVDKNGKLFSPGQIAAHQRIKECANEWHTAKSAGTLQAGMKWPQFWSSCNTRLKAHG